MIHDFKFAACAFLLMVCLAGCGHGGGFAMIEGTVSYDGQPVKKGTIAFVPADGNGPTAAAPIADGRYSLKIAPGRKLVRIEAYEVTGQRPYSRGNPNSPKVDVQKQILPSRYNTKSELTSEITLTDHTCDFSLEKPPAARR